MRGRVTAAVVFVALAVAASSASARPTRRAVDVQSLTVVASPNAPGAHRIRLKLIFRYEMRCNYPGVGPLVVTFPSALGLPKRFGAHSVKLAGKPVVAKRKGRRVTVTVPPPSGVLCGIVGPGSVKLVFTRKARLASPTRAGSYRFTARHEKRAFGAKLAIRPAG
jgi:hypothetical protein